MIRAAFSSLAGAWIAQSVERGDIAERLAVPLTLLATRLPTAVILAGAVGYGFYRLNREARAPEHCRVRTRRPRPNRTGTRQTSKNRADV